ncbi:MAG: hypothetical protein CMJ84_00160 [Planctomycetes bacterium]|nr:hypothetical protein [Planctomycetota bacterium]
MGLVLTAWAVHVQTAGAQAFRIGANFTGSTRNVNASFSPPDSMGAVGLDHVAELINGRFAVYDKSGATLQSKTLNAFWQSSGAGFNGSFAFDPRILYDPFSQRYFATSVDNSHGNNNFLVAVSDSSDPTGGWSGFKLDSDADNTRWADFPTMGINGDALVISANMFAQTNQVESQQVSLLAIPKSDLLATTPTIANRTFLEDAGSGRFTLQPVVDMDNGTLPLPMLTASRKDTGRLERLNVNGPINAMSLSFGPFIVVTARGDPPNAEQPGPKKDIDTSNNRFSGNVILQDGSLWAAQGVSLNGRAAVEWYEIRESDNTIVQNGLISDTELAYYYPSIAVNDFGDVVIGFSGSSENQFVSTYAAVGRTNGGVTQFGDVTLLKAGVEDYQITDSSNRNRWGDYSATVLDPANPLHFWTFQELVSADNQWSTQITQIVVPEPSMLALVILGGGLVLRPSRRARFQRA